MTEKPNNSILNGDRLKCLPLWSETCHMHPFWSLLFRTALQNRKLWEGKKERKVCILEIKMENYLCLKMIWTCTQKISNNPQNKLFSSVQLLSRVQLLATPWISARQASLSITNSQSSPRLTSIKSVMPSSHLILCRPLLLLPPIRPSIRVFSKESTLRMRWPKYWSLNINKFINKYIYYYLIINKLLELINEFSKLTDKRSTHKIQLHFYTLAVNNLKIKLRKHLQLK